MSRLDDYVADIQSRVIEADEVDTGGVQLKYGIYTVPAPLEEWFDQSTNPNVFDLTRDFLTTAVTGKKFDLTEELFGSMPDEIATIPMCKCTDGKGLIGAQYDDGTICRRCGEPVTSGFLDRLEYRGWFDLNQLEGVPPILLSSVYRVINSCLSPATKKGQNMLQELMNPAGVVPEFLQEWYQPSMTSFYQNFDRLMAEICSNADIIKRRGTHIDDLKTYIAMYRDRLFTSKIPIANSALHMINRNEHSIRTDQCVQYLRDMATNLLTIGTLTNYAPGVGARNRFEKLLFDAHQKYIEYNAANAEFKLYSKEGLIRHSLLGHRCQMTFRTVITPIVEPHEVDSLKLPWQLVLEVMKRPIQNRLRSRYPKKDINWILRKYRRAIVLGDDDIYEIINELIEESPYRGIPCLVGRQPSMQPGAVQLLFFDEVYRDIRIHSMAVSSMAINAQNADHDGDELWGMMLFENDAIDDFMGVHPRVTLLGRNSMKLTNQVRMTEQTRVHMQCWLNAHKAKAPFWGFKVRTTQ